MRRIPTAEIKIADGLEEKNKIHYILWEAAKPPIFIGTDAGESQASVHFTLWEKCRRAFTNPGAL